MKKRNCLSPISKLQWFIDCVEIYKQYLSKLSISEDNKRVLTTIFEDKLERMYYGQKGAKRKTSEIKKGFLKGNKHKILAWFYLKLVDRISRQSWISPYWKSILNAFILKKIQECLEIVQRHTDKTAEEIRMILENNINALDQGNQRDIEILFMEWNNKPPEKVDIFCSTFRLFGYGEFAQYLLKSNSKITITEVQHGAITYWYKNSRLSKKIEGIAKSIHYWDPENKNSITRYGTFVRGKKRKGSVWIGRPIYDNYFLQVEPEMAEDNNNLGIILRKYKKAIEESCCGLIEHPKGSPKEYKNSDFKWGRTGWISSLEGKQMIFDTVNASLIYMAIKRNYDYIIAIDEIEKYRTRMTQEGKKFIDYLIKEKRIVEKEEALLERITYHEVN